MPNVRVIRQILSFDFMEALPVFGIHQDSKRCLGFRAFVRPLAYRCMDRVRKLIKHHGRFCPTREVTGPRLRM